MAQLVLIVVFVLSFFCVANTQNLVNVHRLSCLTLFQLMEIRDNNVYVMGTTTTESWDTQIPHIYKKIDDGFEELPITFDNQGKIDSVLLSPGGHMKLDSKGNLWVSGYQKLYKYDGQKWAYFFINDTFNHNRSYRDIVIDKFDNVWFQTRTKGVSNITNGISELVRFDGTKFDIAVRRNHSVGFATKSYNHRSGFSTLDDGRVVVQIIPLPEDSEQFPKDVLIVDQDLSITFSQSKTLDYPKIKRSSITKIIQVSDTSFYALFGYVVGGGTDSVSGNQYFSRHSKGVAYVTNDTNWFPLDSNNGLPAFNGHINEQPMKTICRLPNGEFLVMSSQEPYILDHNQQFRRKPWKELIANATIYGTSSFYSRSLDLYDSIVTSVTRGNPYNWNPKVNEVGVNGNILYILGEQILFEVALENVTSIHSQNESVPIVSTKEIVESSTYFFENHNKEKVSYEVYSLQGELLLKGVTTSSSIQLGGLTQGCYSIVLTFENSTIQNKLILKVVQ